MKNLLPLFLLVPMFHSMQVTAQELSGQDNFVRYAEKLREIWRSKVTFTSDVKENAEKMQKIVFGDDAASEIADFEYTGFIIYLSALYASDPSPAKNTLALELLESLESPMEIESMWLVSKLLNWYVFGNYYIQFSYEDIITPLARSHDPVRYEDGIEIMIKRSADARGILYPTTYRREFQIPQKFVSLGLYDKAWRAYCEHADASTPGGEGQLSRYAAINWKHAADCAYLAGEKKLAWQLLMKAAVFGDESLFAEVKATAELWQSHEQSGKEIPRPEILQGDQRREAWVLLVNAYQSMNAHPRVWALIDEYPDEFDNPEKLKKAIQEDWLELTQKLIPTQKNSSIKSVTVYGYCLYPDGVDPLTVEIPWAFSEGSIEKAKEEFRQGAKTLLTGDILRRWDSLNTGGAEVYARIVSINEKYVTLKLRDIIMREDGETIAIEQAKLSPDDQEYVKLRLEAEKGVDIFASEAFE